MVELDNVDLHCVQSLVSLLVSIHDHVLACSLFLHRGICHLSHVSLSGYHSAEGHTSVLPAMRNVSLPLLCG